MMSRKVILGANSSERRIMKAGVTRNIGSSSTSLWITSVPLND